VNVKTNSEADRKAMSFAMNLSLGVGLLMFVMKMGAYERRHGYVAARSRSG
jgi:hypothetical protein